MVGTMERRMNAWIDRNLNGYTSGLGTAVGLDRCGCMSRFGCWTFIFCHGFVITHLGAVVSVLVAAAIATPFTRDRGKPTLL